jgi:2'-5' RNA ligase
VRNQLSMFERPQRPVPRGDPVYFAALPGEQMGSSLTALRAWLGREFGVRAAVTDARRLHVSVLGLGIVHELLPEETAIAAAVASGFAFAPFELRFTRVMSYRRKDERWPIVLLPDPADLQVPALAWRLAEAAIASGVDPRGDLGGEPHMTLMYDAARVPLTDLPEPITTRIESVALVHSHWGKGRRTILARTAT